MADDVMTNEDHPSCSTAPPSTDTATGKRATSKSFRSFFRRKKKPARMREHCMSVDESAATAAEYQRHHGGHYQTVSGGTATLGHVIHDQFSRRHLRRAHPPAAARCATNSVSEEDDDDVVRRPDVTSSRGYFRWRYRSAPDAVVDDDAEGRSAGGTGGLGGSRVRHWIYSIRQRSRSGDDPPRSARSKFKVTPARTSSSSTEGRDVTEHDVIGPEQFSEIVRNRTNSDPCFEAWLKAKAAANRRQVRLINIHDVN